MNVAAGEIFRSRENREYYYEYVYKQIIFV